MSPQVWQELQRHTFKIIYSLEGYLHVIAIKSTNHVTSSVWMKSVLLIRAHPGQLKRRKVHTPTVLLSNNSLSVIIEEPCREA